MIYMKHLLLLSLLATMLSLSAQPQRGGIERATQASPDGALKVNLSFFRGYASYDVTYNDKPMLERSPLGLDTSIGSFAEGLKPIGATVRTVDETYYLPHAKAREVHYTANEWTQTCLNSAGDTLQIIFSISNNDIALRYRLASPQQFRCTILRERTGFNFPQQTTTFITPQAPWGEGFAKSKPSYEEPYVTDEPIGMRSQYGLGYTFPALFRIGNDGWVLLSETGVDGNYVGSKLSESSRDGLYTIAFPEPQENASVGDATVTAALPLYTSWKTISVGETLKPIVETTSAYNTVKPLYQPSIDYRPGKGTWSWILWQDDSCNYNDQVTFINLASTLGFEYILIDAWWDTRIGHDGIAKLARYAATKGVNIILWYNSNGSWNDAPQGPRNKMVNAPERQREMAWMQSIGVKGIKVDFFGGDKQVTMKYYEDILTDANRYGIAVNFHGTTLPRGWERMFPNFITAEAALVSENLVFSQGFADSEAHTATLLPFIRNAVSSMDFGPVFFSPRFSKSADRGTIRRTTDAYQAASAVLYQSGIQHFGIVPDNLKTMPDYLLDYIKKVPTAWDETRFVDGYPGKYVVIARRQGDHWYVAAANAEPQAKKLMLTLPWLAGQEVKLISDAGNGTLGSTFKTVKVDKNGRLTVTLQTGGGMVLF
jgi:hypothetical protein